LSSEELKLIVDDSLTSVMEERGITKEDVGQVLRYAESSGNKLCKENKSHCLAKQRLENFTVYVEYQIEHDSYKLLNVYSHRVSLTEDE